METVGEFAAAFQYTKDFRAARLGVIVALKNQRTGAFRHHKAVAVLGERLGGFRRIFVLGRQRGEEREAHKALRVYGTVGGDTQRGVGFAPADGFETELDRAGAGGAGGRQRDRRSLRAELVGEVMADRAEHEAFVDILEFAG